MELHPSLDEAQRPSDDQTDIGKPSASWYYKEAFESLFPGEEVPEEVGAPCCAEFAVTDRMIRQRPRSDYERYRRWLTETEFSDYVSGRTFEYSWHSKGSFSHLIYTTFLLTRSCGSHLWPRSRLLSQRTDVLLQAIRALQPEMRE